MMNVVDQRKKIFKPLLARQGIKECCDSLYFLPGDYQGSLAIRAVEDDKGKGVTPAGCHDNILDLQVPPQLAPPIMTNGISVALLAIATGVAIASDGKAGMRVAQNIQPVGINRVVLNGKVTKAFTHGNIADTYRGKNPGETHEVHNFTFLACVCEWDNLPLSHPVAPTFGPNNLLGGPKARLLSWDDVQRLSQVLLGKDIEKNMGRPEEELVKVLGLVNTQYNSFKKVGDFEVLLGKLCGKLHVIAIGDLECSGIDDICFLVKIAWASLQLPILGAVSGQTRMLAASHVLQGIEPSNDGKNCSRKKGSLQIRNGETPASLNSTTAQVEFLIVSNAGCCLTEDAVTLIYNEALQRQSQAMRGDPLSFQEVVLGLMKSARHNVDKGPSESFRKKTFVSNLQLPWVRVAESLLTLSQIEGVPIKALTAAHKVRSPNTTLSKGVRELKSFLSRHKEPVWNELFQKDVKRSSIRSVKVEFFASLVGIEIADTIAKSPHQAFWDFFQHNGSSRIDSAWQQEKPMGVWMHPAKPSETGEYVGEWVQKMKGEATGIWWVSPSTLEIEDCELSWTLTLEAGLLRPLASFFTAGLLQKVVYPPIMSRSMGLYEKIVREWVYAFLWEVLVWSEGFAVPIPAAWQNLQNLRELLAVVYKDELGLVSWVSVALKACQPGKEFCTNLFGIVGFMLGLLAWEDSGYSLSSSFTEIKSIHGKRNDGSNDKGLLAPACFRVSCPLVVWQCGRKKLSLFQWLQELLDNSDASNKLADKVDKEYLCNRKIGEKSNSLVAGLFGNHEKVPNIKESFLLNLSSLPDETKADGDSAAAPDAGPEGPELGPEVKDKGNSASGASEGVGEDGGPLAVTVEQGLKKTKENALLLGMTQPDAKELVSLANRSDKRDLARIKGLTTKRKRSDLPDERKADGDSAAAPDAGPEGPEVGPEVKDKGNSASGASEGVGEDRGPLVATVEQGLKKTKENVLLLGMTQPATDDWKTLDNRSDKRDSVRCWATAVPGKVNVYTVSKAAKLGVPQNPDRHLQADFAKKHFIKEMKNKFGQDIVFDQVVLDYIWMPDAYADENLTKTFYYNILPNLASLLTSKGKIFLPCLPTICLKLMEANSNLKEHYEITFLAKDELDDHKLWDATERINKKIMQDVFGKDPNQLETNCSNLVKSLLESSSTQVSPGDIKAVFGRIKHPIMVCLRHLGQEEEGAIVGGIKGLTTKRKRSDNSDEESNDEDEAIRASKQKKSALWDKQKVLVSDIRQQPIRKEAVQKKAEKEEERRKAEKHRKKDEKDKERRKEAEKQRKKDEKDKESDDDTEELLEEAPTFIYPGTSLTLSKGEMLVAPCDKTKFERVSSKVEFRQLNLGEGLNIYVCDFIPVEHLKNMTNFHGSSRFQETLEATRNKILPYDVRTSDKEFKIYKNTNLHSYGNYYPYLEKGLNEKVFEYHATLKEDPPSEVEKFLRDVSKGLNEVTGNELLNGDLEIHGLCIDTVKPVHQRAHIDNASSYDVDKLSFVGHMPLDQEGMVLRLENISSEMRECLLQKERNLDEKVEIVDAILYIHVPFGSILVIDDRTFHGGHYCSKQVRRFHFVVSPRKWRDEEQGDRLLFLLEAARQQTKKWREHTGHWKIGGWAEKDDPKVARPKLPIGELQQMIDKIQYSTRTKYYESFVKHCYPGNTLDNLKMVSKLIPEYIYTKCFDDSTK